MTQSIKCFVALVAVLVVCSVVEADTLTIAAAEYFFDTDPGPGNGIPFSITPGSEPEVSATFSLPPLDVGFHRLYVRYQTADSIWSSAEGRQFFVLTPVPDDSCLLASAEYFLDTDPGIGLGTPVEFNDTSEVAIAFEIEPFAVSQGFHRLYVRYQTADGIRSSAEGRQFFVLTPVQDDSRLLASAEYFLDTDPGIGLGTPVEFNDTSEVAIAFEIDPFTASQGFHRLYVRYQTEDSLWSPAEGRMFFVTATVPGIDSNYIASSEFFFDSDPGYGQGIPLIPDDGAFDESDETMHRNISGEGLTVGPHCLYLRVSDNHGISNFAVDSMMVTSPHNLELVAVHRTAVEQVQLIWKGFPEALEYHVYYDSAATGQFISFTTVNSADTSLIVDTIPFVRRGFFLVKALLPDLDYRIGTSDMVRFSPISSEKIDK